MKKPKPPKGDPPSNTGNQGREKENTNRHVYIEPGAQIDFVEDFKKKYETAQTDTTTHNTKQLFWTKIASVLLVATAIFTGAQGWYARKSAKIAQRQFETTTRPWIKVPKTLPDVGTISLDNFGTSPAIVMQPHIYQATLQKAKIRFWGESLKYPDICAQQGTKEMSTYAVFPHDPTNVRLEIFPTETKIAWPEPQRDLIGCIVYYGTRGDGPYWVKVVYVITYEPDGKTTKSIDFSDSEIH